MLKFSSISAFNLGSGRKTNENTTWVKEQLGLYAISDGASGPFGKWAADSVCMKMEEIFSSHRSTIDKYNETQARDLRNQLFEIMDVAVEQVNQYLLAEIKKDPKKSGAAATLSVVLVLQDCAILNHVGNCRIYHLREGKISLLTKDHTRFQQMLDAGFGQENVSSDYKKELTQIMGGQKFLSMKAFGIAMAPDDILLLCTDGLYNGLAWDDAPDPVEFRELASQGNFIGLAGKLVEMASAKGVKDNITALVVRADSTVIKGSRPRGKTIGISVQVETLKKIPVFSRLKHDEATMLKIHNLATLQIAKKGSVLMEQGGKSDKLIVILKGSVDIKRNGELVGSVGSGSFLGEMGVLTEETRSATVIAKEDLELLVILKVDMDRMVSQDKDLGLKIYGCAISELSRKIRDLSDRIETMTKNPA